MGYILNPKHCFVTLANKKERNKRVDGIYSIRSTLSYISYKTLFAQENTNNIKGDIESFDFAKT